MNERPELYFHRDVDWYDWLLDNHEQHPQGIHLIFYKLEMNQPTMRWEEAVKVAICFGWIDSTVRSLGGGKRLQYFCPRSPKSTWSALNKSYVLELQATNLLHPSGHKMIELAKKTGTWTAMEGPDAGIIPQNLQQAFDENIEAYNFFQSLTPGYQKSHLRWLATAKRQETQNKRIATIISLCEQKIKSR